MLRVVLSWLSLVTMTTAALADDILIFGATRNTGLETAKILVVRGDAVTAFVRETSDTSALRDLGVALVVGDALQSDTVDAAFAAGPFDSVISTISGSVRNSSVDSDGNINIFAATERAGVKRMVLVTAIGAGGTEGALEDRARQFLKPVLDAKTIAEADLKSRDLDWTILRPGQLPEGPATGSGVLYENQTLMGRITMGELAFLVVKALDDEATIGKVFHAIDSEMIGSFSSFD